MSGVAVVIPNLNGGKWIAQALESVRAQTVEPVAVVVVDGGSTDDSVRIVKDCSDVWLRHQHVPGRGRSRNAGIAFAARLLRDRDFILPLDSDDWIDPTFIEKCLPLFEDPRVGVVSTGLIYEYDNRVVDAEFCQYPDEPVTLDRLLTANRIFSCSMFRLDCWREVGGYDTTHPTHEDWDFWIRIVAAGWKVACVHEPLFHYRVHPESSTASARPGSRNDLLFRAYLRKKHAALFALCGVDVQ